MVHAELHHRIYVFSFTDALVETEYCLIDHRQQDTVGNKPWKIVGFCRCFSELLAKLPGDIKSFLGCGQPTDNLNQFHDRYRVHKMHTDNFVGSVCLSCNPSDGNRRRVGT